VSEATKNDFEEAVLQLRHATVAKKCWPCGCLHTSLDSIEQAFANDTKPTELTKIMSSARQRLTDVKYECLGCEVCHPAIALNALQVDFEACPTDAVAEREGWPQLPGSYTVLRYRAPVAVCTLTDDALAAELAHSGRDELAVVGTLQTENLGIERLILNTVANPYIRFLVLSGADSQQAIGHLPGQSLVALAGFGVDDRMRIIGANGKRPWLRNITMESVEHFRRSVEVLDHVGETSPSVILEAVAEAGTRNLGPAQPFAPERVVPTVTGRLPERMVQDPAGYFVVYPDRKRRLLSLEHYRNDGVLDVVIEGMTAAEVVSGAVGRNLLSRLDHAAYLGRELARAEHALETGDAYVQDAAAERQSKAAATSCGCGSSCGDKT
jgi:tetrahydromethanopterin S-methyltransferase subunit A